MNCRQAAQPWHKPRASRSRLQELRSAVLTSSGSRAHSCVGTTLAVLLRCLLKASAGVGGRALLTAAH